MSEKWRGREDVILKKKNRAGASLKRDCQDAPRHRRNPPSSTEVKTWKQRRGTPKNPDGASRIEAPPAGNPNVKKG